MAIKIGIAPDSWGVWFPASDPNNAKQPQWWRCLDEMKVAGYEGCEIGPWGYMPNDDPKVLKNAMDARGLTLVGATEGGNFLDDAAVEGMLKDIDDISKLLKAFPSAKYIVLLPPMYTNLATGELLPTARMYRSALTAAQRTASLACSIRTLTATFRPRSRSSAS